jgi:predicted Zn finger-like uncharacterized protein
MFRVASDQLKLRGGIVRCGACQEIFDGSATLVDLDALPARAPVAPQPASAQAAPATPAAPSAPSTPSAAESPGAAAAVPEAAPAAEPESDPLPFTIVDGPAESSDAATEGKAPDFDGQPVYTLDFDHTFDPFGILPKVDAAEANPASPAEAVTLPAMADAAPEPEPDAAPEMPPEEPAAALEAEAVAEAPVEAAPVEAETAAAAETAAQAEVAAEPAAVEAAPIAPAPAALTSDKTASIEPTPAPVAPVRTDEKKPAAAMPVPSSGSGRVEPSLGLPVDEELVARALPDHDPEPASKTSAPRAADAPPLPMREAAASVINAHAPSLPSAPPVARTPAVRRAEKAAARRSRLTPTRIDAPPKIRVPESDEPEFVRRSRQQEQSGRTRKIAMLAGSVVLLLILVAQGAITFRNALAARFPAAKPALVSGCAVLGCRVELPAQIDNLVIETGELTTLGGGAYAFTTQLANRSAVPQAWPSLELSLTDANDKPLVRRVFAPRDYLAAGTPTTTGLAPRVEQAIKLHFRVDDLQPSGYHIAVFYP